MNTPDAIDRLCLACGLCCNGVLFRDVELQGGDNPEALQKLGLPILRSRFAQPCPALCDGNKCRVYEQRPKRCHDFECGVLKAVIAGKRSVDDALRLVRRTLGHVVRIKALLRKLDDCDEHLPLARRFRRTQRRVETSQLDEASADLFAELALEVHHLNLLTYAHFYTRETVDTP